MDRRIKTVGIKTKHSFSVADFVLKKYYRTKEQFQGSFCHYLALIKDEQGSHLDGFFSWQMFVLSLGQ